MQKKLERAYEVLTHKKTQCQHKPHPLTRTAGPALLGAPSCLFLGPRFLNMCLSATRPLIEEHGVLANHRATWGASASPGSHSKSGPATYEPSATASSSVASYRGAMRCHGTELGSSPSAHHSTSSSFEAARVLRGSKRRNERSGRRRARNDGRAFEVDEDDARDEDVARDENVVATVVATVALELAMDSDDDDGDIFCRRSSSSRRVTW